MTFESYISELEGTEPGFVPFQNYVSGMTSSLVPLSFGDPFLHAAAYVYFDDLDGAHHQLQALEGQPYPDYLHGIIHRREGDFWNADYWFRRAGSVAGVNAEDLTRRVQEGVDDALRDELVDEWKGLVRGYLGS